ncbi:MAG: HU family DNA-binding protein [Lutimonas sp.]
MLKVKFLKRRDPRDIASPEKYYLTTVSKGSINLKELAERIAYQSTLTPGDCYNVLSSLEKNIIVELKMGNIVRLGELGTFRVSISSEGKDTSEELTVGAIKKARILFRPAQGLRDMLRNLVFRKETQRLA